MSQVITLPPHGDHVHISNRYRTASEGAFQFRVPTFALPMAGVGSYLMMLKQVKISHFVPNIQTGVNDLLSVTVNGITTVIVLASYNYNIDAMVSALNTALDNINAGLVLTYNYDFKYLTLQIPAATTFSFNSPGQEGVQDGLPSLQSRYDRLLSMLGFYDVRNRSYTGVTVIQGSIVDLFGTRSLKVHVNQNMSVFSCDPNNPQIIADVPVSVDYGNTIVYEPSQPRTFVLNPVIMEYLQISVSDDYGERVVNVPSNAVLELSWTMVSTSKSYD